MIVWSVILIALLIAIASVEVPQGGLGSFERRRRQRQGITDDKAVERELYYDDVIAVQRSLQALCIVALSIYLAAAGSWQLAAVVAIILIAGYGVVSRQAFVRKLTTSLYERIEPGFLGFIARHQRLVGLLRAWPVADEDRSLHSRDELVHLIQDSKHVLSSEEKALLLAGIGFADVQVSEVMTPRSMIESIGRSELLGPLVLDEFHKKGHSRFPVIDGDLDHVVGVLHLQDALTLDTSRKHTSRVETAMEPRVFYIHEEQSLQHALAAFIRTHHHLFIVVNEFRETVGLLTLEDVLERLIGREIVDEYDTHDDLRAVAKRSPRANPSTGDTVDV